MALTRDDHAEIAETVALAIVAALDARPAPAHQCFLSLDEQAQTKGIASKTRMFENSFIKAIGTACAGTVVAALVYYFGFGGRGPG